MAAEGVFPKVDGDILYASEANVMHTPSIYTYAGSQFNAYASGTNQTVSDVGSYVFPFIGPGSIVGKDKVLAFFNIKTDLNAANTATTFVIAKATSGGAYSAEKTYSQITSNGNIQGLNYFVDLTSDDKTTGFNIMIVGSVSIGTGYGANSALITNEYSYLQIV